MNLTSSPYSLDQFQLVVLSGKCETEGPFSSLYEQVFSMWKEAWISIFTEAGSPQAFNPDIFFRTEIIPVIVYKNEIVGFFLASIYPLSHCMMATHSYFSIFSQECKSELVEKRVKSVMSYEYLTVTPKWRKNNLGFSIGSVLIELGLNFRNESACGAAIGVASIKAKVNSLAHDNGARTLMPLAIRGGLHCEVVVFYPENDKTSSNPLIGTFSNDLWNRRKIVNRFGHPIEREDQRLKVA